MKRSLNSSERQRKVFKFRFWQLIIVNFKIQTPQLVVRKSFKMKPEKSPRKSCWERILDGARAFLFKFTLYFGFYGCIGLLLTAMYYGFLEHSGGAYHPETELGSFIIRDRPGMRFFPLPPGDHYNSFTIWYNRSNPKHTALYTRSLLGIINQEFNAKHLKSVEYVSCTHACPYINGAVVTNMTAEHKLCSAYDHRNLDWGECSPSGASVKNCSGPFALGTRAFGFTEGRPCIMLRLNKIDLWKPSDRGLTEEKVKEYESVKVDIQRDWLERTRRFPSHESYIWVYCGGVTQEDQELMGDIAIYPKSRPAIPKVYFPFLSQRGYVAPFIFIQFRNPTPHVILRIQCMAFDNNFNIKQHIFSPVGTINFELLID